MTDYIGLIRKEAESDFGVDFPDFPGCITAGSSLDEARAMAQEALQGHIESMEEESLEIPAPSRLETVMANPDNMDAVAALITVRGAKQNSVRVNITVYENVLREIDEKAKEQHLSRSAFLADAAMKVIHSTNKT